MTKPSGRPTLYKPEYDDIAYKLCLLGANDVQIAEIFEVDVSSIDTWKKKHPTFLKSIKNGKDIADSKVAASLYQRACGYSHPDVHISNHKGDITITPYVKHLPPDPVSCIFWLKNRQRNHWKDKQDVNVTGEVDLKTMTDEELELKKQRLLKNTHTPLKVVG